jgi:hypothetical protein
MVPDCRGRCGDRSMRRGSRFGTVRRVSIGNFHTMVSVQWNSSMGTLTTHWTSLAGYYVSETSIRTSLGIIARQINPDGAVILCEARWIEWSHARLWNR